MLITGFSQQSLEWNAENGDGWMYYPRDLNQQKYRIEEWRNLIPSNQKYSKPFLLFLVTMFHCISYEVRGC